MPDTHAVYAEAAAEQFDATPTSELFDPESVPLAIPVRVEGSVRVEPEPGRTLTARQFLAPVAPDSVQVLFDDPRRASATLVALDNDLLLGVNRGDPIAQWPVGVPLVTAASGPLWVRAVGAATNVTVVTELRAR